MPVHALDNDQASDQVNHLVFNSLKDIITFGKQANDQASDLANAILNNAIHTRVGELLEILSHGLKERNYLLR